MGAVLHHVVAFLMSREFELNFLANLGGAMAGVLLAFGIERCWARRDAQTLYGRVLQTSRSELAYLRPMFGSSTDALGARKSGSIFYSLSAPATRALLTNPLVHERAPYSLIMAVTILCHFFEITESAVQEARQLKATDPVTQERLSKMLADQLHEANNLITIALEQIDSQLKLLGLEKAADKATLEISRRLQEVLQSPLSR
jgi:hypothetical protein